MPCSEAGGPGEDDQYEMERKEVFVVSNVAFILRADDVLDVHVRCVQCCPKGERRSQPIAPSPQDPRDYRERRRHDQRYDLSADQLVFGGLRNVKPNDSEGEWADERIGRNEKAEGDEGDSGARSKDIRHGAIS